MTVTCRYCRDTGTRVDLPAERQPQACDHLPLTHCPRCETAYVNGECAGYPFCPKQAAE